jgi:hypothetical protein
MPRLFITPREIDFFNDISKEVTKDLVGQKIYYYPISFDKTDVDEVYEEAVTKILENPIEINCIVDWQPAEVKTNKFGQDSILSIKVYIQSRDMIQKEIELKDGDFFSYGTDIFEIMSVRTFRNIYGQVEYDDGIELIGRQARKDNFAIRPLGPLEERLSDEDAVQDTFVQQRGFDENKEGQTGDKRDLVDKGVLDPPIVSEPAEISERGQVGKAGNAFYGEGDTDSD